MDVVSLHANNSLYCSKGNAEEDQMNENRSDTSEGSPHSDILSCILSVARIWGHDDKEEAPTPAPTQGVWVSISHMQPPASIPVAEDYSQMLKKAWIWP